MSRVPKVTWVTLVTRFWDNINNKLFSFFNIYSWCDGWKYNNKQLDVRKFKY